VIVYSDDGLPIVARSGATGATDPELRSGPGTRDWEAGGIAAREAARVHEEVMGDRRKREREADERASRHGRGELLNKRPSLGERITDRLLAQDDERTG
jgi:hypothetical protein